MSSPTAFENGSPLRLPAAYYGSRYFETDECGWGPQPGGLYYGLAVALAQVFQEAESVLDCGCGSGSLVEHLANVFPCAIGVDWSEHALAHPVSPGLMLLPGDLAARIPGDDRSYDLVVSWQVLEHLDVATVDAALTEMARAAGRWMVHCICLAPPESPERDDPGHTLLRSRAWWLDRVPDGWRHDPEGEAALGALLGPSLELFVFERTDFDRRPEGAAPVGRDDLTDPQQHRAYYTSVCRGDHGLLLNPENYEAPRVSWLLAHAAGRILDVGCGTGELTNRLKETGFRVVGLDPSEQHVRIARQRFPECEFWQGFTEDLASDIAEDGGERFDTVLCGEVIEHVLDPVAFLAALRRLGRSVHLTTPLGRWEGSSEHLCEFALADAEALVAPYGGRAALLFDREGSARWLGLSVPGEAV